MTIEEMRRRKRELGFTNQSLSEASGVPLGTVQKVLSGRIQAPRKATIDRLTAVLSEDTDSLRGCRREEAAVFAWQEPPFRGQPYVKGELPGLQVRDPAYAEKLPEKIQGEYTIEDYFALPDDVRMELIDGVFYDMAEPTTPHQFLVGEIYAALRECIRKHGLPCAVLSSPTGVQLDRDNRTVVEPDVLVLCDREKLQRKVIYGAPDLVVEVLSPATARKDKTLKLHKYSNAGVREYWIVDPDRKSVICYDLEQKEVPIRIHSFADRVPVQISDGKCEIDFAEINTYLGQWFPDWG